MSFEKRPAADWAAIKQRYVVGGERPTAIAQDYLITPQTIGQRAKAEGWAEDREKHQQAQEDYQNSLRDKVFRQRNELMSEAMDTFLSAIHSIKTHMTANNSPYKTDKEGGTPDPYYLEAYRLAKDLVKSALSGEEEKQDGTTPAGGPVYRCIYTTSEPDAPATGHLESQDSIQ